MAPVTVYPSQAETPLLHLYSLSPVMRHERSGSYLPPDIHLVRRIGKESLTERPEAVGHGVPEEIEWPSLPWSSGRMGRPLNIASLKALL